MLRDINPDVDSVDHLMDKYPEELLNATPFLANRVERKNGGEVDQESDSSQWELYQNPMVGDNIQKSIFGGAGFLPADAFTDDDSFVTFDHDYNNYNDIVRSIKFTKAGPRKNLFYNPSKVKALIVTCGGLCPGLNVVIRELVMALHFSYEVREIYGVKWGYKGLYTDIDKNWLKLDPDAVKMIHKEGGTILGSSRGGFDADKILDSLIENGVNQLYVIGGDGTHRGINVLIQRALERKVVLSIAGVPKTIDNDIPLIDFSFGFNTSVEIASRMIDAVYTEATSSLNGVGVVKLMGRYSGFIAQYAAMGNNAVDFCLIPELPFQLSGPNGVYENIVSRVKQQGHCIVVVAEGAEEGLIGQKITKV
jgi:6-phosphofructokinase 1